MEVSERKPLKMNGCSWISLVKSRYFLGAYSLLDKWPQARRRTCPERSWGSSPVLPVEMNQKTRRFRQKGCDELPEMELLEEHNEGPLCPLFGSPKALHVDTQGSRKDDLARALSWLPCPVNLTF